MFCFSGVPGIRRVERVFDFTAGPNLIEELPHMHPVPMGLHPIHILYFSLHGRVLCVMSEAHSDCRTADCMLWCYTDKCCVYNCLGSSDI